MWRKNVFEKALLNQSIHSSKVSPPGPLVGGYLDELLQLGAVLQLGVAVEQQRGVVGVGQRLAVQRLQVGRQVVDPLGVQELPDHVGRLQLPDGSERGKHARLKGWLGGLGLG